jgi:hypothetical protein
MLNTKQVRAIAKAYTGPRFRAQHYTEKTQKQTNPNSKRRSVVFCFWDAQDADAFAGYMLRNMQNKITRTSVGYDMWTRRTGGEYVRIIADIS